MGLLFWTFEACEHYHKLRNLSKCSRFQQKQRYYLMPTVDECLMRVAFYLELTVYVLFLVVSCLAFADYKDLDGKAFQMSFMFSESIKWLIALYWNMCWDPSTRSMVSSRPRSAWSRTSTPATSDLTTAKTAALTWGFGTFGETLSGSQAPGMWRRTRLS